MAQNRENPEFIVFDNLVESGSDSENTRGSKVRTMNYEPPASFQNGNAAGGIVTMSMDEIAQAARSRAARYRAG